MKKSTVGFISLIFGALILGTVCVTVPAVNKWFGEQGDKIQQQLGNGKPDDSGSTGEDSSDTQITQTLLKDEVVDFSKLTFADNVAYTDENLSQEFNECVKSGNNFFARSDTGGTRYVYHANTKTALKLGNSSYAGAIRISTGASYFNSLRIEYSIEDSTNHFLCFNIDQTQVLYHDPDSHSFVEFNTSTLQNQINLTGTNAKRIYIYSFTISTISFN